MALIGKPLSRIEGRLKVTGAAPYAAEFNQPNLAYGFPVQATIASGTITAMDTGAAQKSGGVITVLTHQNAPRLRPLRPEELRKAGGSLGEDVLPLQDTKVEYFGQLIGLVVAETYEQARAAAALVQVRYAQQPPAVDLVAELPQARRPEKNLFGQAAQLNAGQAAAPLAAAANRVEATYTTAIENHHPMEPHATIAVWEGPGKLTTYHASQGVMSARATLAYLFNLPPRASPGAGAVPRRRLRRQGQ